jgi:hypothetical protein
MKHIFYTTLLILGVAVGIAILQPADAALAAAKDEICSGVNVVAGGSGCATGNTQIYGLAKTIVQVFSIVVGIVAVIMIIVGGFKYITSGGDSGNITSAKNTIVYAVIGLVIVALAQFIVQFVLTRVNTPAA